MPLDTEFRTQLKADLKDHEGSIDYFYKDSVGQITIGVGHLIRTEGEAAVLRLCHRDNGKTATPAEVKAAFQAVKNEPFKITAKHKTKIWTAPHYKDLPGASNIYMPPQEIDRLLDRHVDDFYGALKRKFSKKQGYSREFDDYPKNVQLALFDMIFNLGASKFPAHWPSFAKALKKEDWKEAAKQSNRPQLSDARNDYVSDLLLLGDPKTPKVPNAVLLGRP